MRAEPSFCICSTMRSRLYSRSLQTTPNEFRIARSVKVFTCNAAATPKNRLGRAESLTIRILIATEHSSIQALTEFYSGFGANR